MVVWQFTETEATGAMLRLRRDGELDDDGLAESLRRLSAFARRWDEFRTTSAESLAETRAAAIGVMRRNILLRSADALQFAAALGYYGSATGHPFVTADRTLAAVAAAEGFSVVRPRLQSRGGRKRF